MPNGASSRPSSSSGNAAKGKSSWWLAAAGGCLAAAGATPRRISCLPSSCSSRGLGGGQGDPTAGGWAVLAGACSREHGGSPPFFWPIGSSSGSSLLLPVRPIAARQLLGGARRLSERAQPYIHAPWRVLAGNPRVAVASRAGHRHAAAWSTPDHPPSIDRRVRPRCAGWSA